MPAADAQVERGVDELHRLGGDPAGGEDLQGELGGVDVTAAVVPDVHDEPVLWRLPDAAPSAQASIRSGLRTHGVGGTFGGELMTAS
ncbi:hypothetical protein SHIRM173S_12197 [Streptomyces hirsutus]